MSGFREDKGFQDGLAPPAPKRARITKGVLSGGGARSASHTAKAKLARVVVKAPEVMVKITGKTKGAGHLTAHLEYTSRNGAIPLEMRDGSLLLGRSSITDLAENWAHDVNDVGGRRTANHSVSIVLSMPPGTPVAALQDAVRAFADDTFGGRFDYAFAYHDDTAHPHVHLTVKALGDNREKLNPRKGDLAEWRETFATKLRERGIAAEATPRRARGVTIKSERIAVRKLKQRGVVSKVELAAKRDAIGLASGKDKQLREWERASFKRQESIRAAYLKDAADLSASPEAADRALGKALTAFVRDMPAPTSQRILYAEALRREIVAQRSEQRENIAREKGTVPEKVQDHDGPKDKGRGR